MDKHPTLILGGTPVRTNEANLVSLNDIYNAACAQGIADGKLEPKLWAQKPRAKKSGSSGKTSTSGGPGRDFIDFVADNLKVDAAHLYISKPGQHGGGTFAHWQIALAYAKYLSPELHMQVNEVYLRAKSGDVTLADQIADKATPEQQDWLAKRVAGKAARGQFTSTLQAHGVVGKGFADCTNAIYRPILGGKKSEICAQRGLSRRTNLRDTMDLEQLTRTALAEIVARKSIERFNVRGNDRCANECSRAAERVAAI
jgi:hypothetical protein